MNSASLVARVHRNGAEYCRRFNPRPAKWRTAFIEARKSAELYSSAEQYNGVTRPPSRTVQSQLTGAVSAANIRSYARSTNQPSGKVPKVRRWCRPSPLKTLD